MSDRENFWVNDKDVVRLVDLVHHTATRSRIHDIPQEIHFIWLGSSLPEKYTRIIESWRALHPGWLVTIWNDAEATVFMASDKRVLGRQFHAATNFGMKSDILRYEVLLSRGGIYVDIDYECIKSIESASWWGMCEAFAGWSHTNALEINNGIMGTTKDHPLFRQIVDVISENEDMLPVAKKRAIDFAGMESVLAFLGTEKTDLISMSANDAAMKVIQCTGPGMFTRQVYAFLKEQELRGEEVTHAPLILPRAVFHPVPNHVDVDIAETENLARLKAAWVQENTVAIHWWQKSWQKS